MEYYEYLAEQLNKNLKYADYIAEQVYNLYNHKESETKKEFNFPTIEEFLKLNIEV